MAIMGRSLDFSFAVFLVAVVGLGVLGPYSLLSSVYAIEFGGQAATGTASSLLDGTGSLFASTLMMVKSKVIGGSVQGEQTGLWVVFGGMCVSLLVMLNISLRDLRK